MLAHGKETILVSSNFAIALQNAGNGNGFGTGPGNGNGSC
jgi:hypothetical protein